ncbi:MAG: zinc metalloprotease HtpX [Armatimonadetes bacterium]|nr:zinc metalloprotease HtpX [Armatimonadota bacterium]
MYKQIDANKRNSLLLISFFLILIMTLGWVFSYVLNNTWIFPIAVIFSVSQALIGYYFGDKITLLVSRAKEVRHDENPQFYHIVENLCITAGLPLPKIYIIEDSAPNAFAAGRDPKHALICVTSGLLEKLERPELEGVIAHELSHIGNYDIRLMTIAVVLVGIVSLLSDWFLRYTFWGRREREREENNQFKIIILALAFILAILAPLIAGLIQLAISRKREYLADASAALLTRYPEGLAQALEKISQDSEPLEAANKATAHLYIENPLKEHGGWLNNLFNTHPPVEERIKILRNMI